jgi:hypothetical protein
MNKNSVEGNCTYSAETIILYDKGTAFFRANFIHITMATSSFATVTRFIHIAWTGSILITVISCILIIMTRLRYCFLWNKYCFLSHVNRGRASLYIPFDPCNGHCPKKTLLCLGLVNTIANLPGVSTCYVKILSMLVCLWYSSNYFLLFQPKSGYVAC